MLVLLVDLLRAVHLSHAGLVCFDPAFVQAYKFEERTVPAGTALPGEANRCQDSAVVMISAGSDRPERQSECLDISTLLYKLGLFGIDWDNTPYMDNKASVQRGVNQVVRRTGIQLADNLGRVRGTSGINNDLRTRAAISISTRAPGTSAPTPLASRRRPRAITGQRSKAGTASTRSLASCDAIFDTRSDNLLQLLGRHGERSRQYLRYPASPLGRVQRRLVRHACRRPFCFAYGQLYAQYALLQATRADFSGVIRERNLTAIWTEMERQLQGALRIQPAIISNGSEDGWIMPTHLATMGFYILRVRSNTWWKSSPSSIADAYLIARPLLRLPGERR